MPRQRNYYGLNHLHFLTASSYRRARVFDSERFKRQFITTLAELRAELGFRIVGYVLMPEHCHLLIWPSEQGSADLVSNSAAFDSPAMRAAELQTKSALPAQAPKKGASLL